jgi:hypothetical protein
VNTSWLRSPLDDTTAAIERVVEDRPLQGLALLMLSMTASWYLYVPIHELLHALGCLAGGGSVTVLEIQVQYGGALLAEFFPFVQPGGEYAGRLSGFDTHGSDLTYLAPAARPFWRWVVGVVPGGRGCPRARRPIWLGLGAVLGLAPFYNLPGDYYEMGAILTTATLSLIGLDFADLRSDDLPLLIGELYSAGRGGLAVGVVGISTALAVVLAYLTWGLGDVLATRWIGPAEPPGQPQDHQG